MSQKTVKITEKEMTMTVKDLKRLLDAIPDAVSNEGEEVEVLIEVDGFKYPIDKVFGRIVHGQYIGPNDELQTGRNAYAVIMAKDEHK